MTRFRKALAAFAVAGFGSIAIGSGGCIASDKTVLVQCPDPKYFRVVSSVVERRCGTLDCHGSKYRPLRIYGETGLRRPEAPGSKNVGDEAAFSEYKSGGQTATTQAELDDNLLSICGLEPEITDRVVNHDSEPGELTFIRKPRLAEKHKGGEIWSEGKDGDQCLTIWLTGGNPTLACNNELLKN